MLHRLNSAATLIQITTTEAIDGDYELYRTGRTQETISYDHLLPHAAQIRAHPLMLRAISAAKKKNGKRTPLPVF